MWKRADLHEAELLHVVIVAGEHVFGERPLQREQRARGQRLQFRPALQAFGDISEVALLGRGVDDEMERALGRGAAPP